MKRTLSWVPHAKQRPRHGKGGHTYTPAPTKKAEKALAEQWEGEPIDGPIAVRLVLTNTTVEVEIESCDEHENRKLRGDIDNYAKTILDGLNGVAWVDDRQITYLEVTKR